MSMAPQNDAITGGTVLRIPALQSPNFVSGSMGWIVRSDGSVEFNVGTFRGELTSGSNPGAHIVLNNTSTGDALDVYNSANKLIFSIDSSGNATSYQASGNGFIQFNNGALDLGDTGFPLASNPTIGGAVNGTTTELILGSGAPPSGSGESFLALVGDASTANAWIQATQRGVAGALVQTGNNSNSSQLIHMGGYSGTTDAGGHVVVAHGAGFTPTGAVVIGNAPGTFANWTPGVNSSGFTSTNFDVSWHVANTGAVVATSFVTFYAILWG